MRIPMRLAATSVFLAASQKRSAAASSSTSRQVLSVLQRLVFTSSSSSGIPPVLRGHAGGAILGFSGGGQSRPCIPTTTTTTKALARHQPLVRLPTAAFASPPRLHNQNPFFRSSKTSVRSFSKMTQMQLRRKKQEESNSRKSKKLSKEEEAKIAELKAKEFEAFLQENKENADDDDDDPHEEDYVDYKLKRGQRKQPPKHPTPLQQQELRRLAGPDPYDNPTARRIRQWAQVENQIAQVERETLAWVRRVVVGLNLCPFAEQVVHNEDLFRVRVALERDMTDADTIVDIVVYELEHLVQRDRGTTLVVCPNLYRENFIGFLQILDVVEQNLEAQGWEGIVQVAPFHPRFVFDGEHRDDPDAPDHCTNRSPHPIFHLLREDDVSRAVECLPNGGDASTVWLRNVQVLRQLHSNLTAEEFQTVVSGQQERPATLRQTVQDVVRQHRIALVNPNANKKNNVNMNNDESSSSSSSSSDEEEEDDDDSSSEEENENDSSSVEQDSHNSENDENTSAANTTLNAGNPPKSVDISTSAEGDKVDESTVQQDKDQRSGS